MKIGKPKTKIMNRIVTILFEMSWVPKNEISVIESNVPMQNIKYPSSAILKNVLKNNLAHIHS